MKSNPEDEKVEMIEVKTNRKNEGKIWYRVRISIKQKKIFITSALCKLLGNPIQVVFAHHPDRIKDWYIRSVVDGEIGIPVQVQEHGGGVIGAARVIDAIQDSLNYTFIENISIMVSKHPEIINSLKYYPLITKALENEANSKQ